MIVIGIDPGINGGIAVLNPNGSVERTFTMPPTPQEFEYELSTYAGFTDSSAYYAHVFLERAQSMPKQGIVSAFNYGRHFGELIGILIGLEIPYTLVPAAKWTKVMHASTKKGTPKQKTLEAVKRLYPSLDLRATPRCKKPHEGIVDALAIATYGVRTL